MFFECSFGVNYRHQFTVYIITFTISKEDKTATKVCHRQKTVKTNMKLEIYIAQFIDFVEVNFSITAKT